MCILSLQPVRLRTFLNLICCYNCLPIRLIFSVLLSSWSFLIAWTKFSFALLGISVNPVYNSDITTSEDKMIKK